MQTKTSTHFAHKNVSEIAKHGERGEFPWNPLNSKSFWGTFEEYCFPFSVEEPYSR